LKTKNPKLRVLLETSVNDESILINGSNRYKKLVNNEINRKKFIKHLIPFLIQHNFDGIDINWRYPNCPFGYCEETEEIDENEKNNFATFITVCFKFENL
jgi:GH18 family chitinase